MRLRRDMRRPFFLQAAPLAAPEALLAAQRQSLALRSLAAFLAAVGFLWPALGETALLHLCALYLFVDGILAVSAGGWRLPHCRAWPLLAGGGIGVAAAAAIYGWPGMSLPLLSACAPIWAIAAGCAFALAGTALRRADRDHLLLLCGIAGVVFGRAMLTQPAGDIVVLSTWTGLYAVTMSILFLKLALQHYRPLLD